MMRVKIIRQQASLLERDINNFFDQLGTQPGVNISLVDIKLYHIGSKDIDTAMIIYNQSKAAPPSPTKR